LNLRSPAFLAAIGVIATLVLALAVVITLLQTGGTKAIADNAALIGGLIALGGLFTSQVVNTALRDRQSFQGGTTEQRIARLTQALSESSHVIQEIEEEMRERSELVERLKRDAQTYERLRNINREEAESVAQALGGELRKEGRRSFRANLVMSFAFFLLGVLTPIVLSIVFGW
jgi:ABC-type multidrug transport system fused ATPase/permease subunit